MFFRFASIMLFIVFDRADAIYDHDDDVLNMMGVGVGIDYAAFSNVDAAFAYIRDCPNLASPEVLLQMPNCEPLFAHPHDVSPPVMV